MSYDKCQRTLKTHTLLYPQMLSSHGGGVDHDEHDSTSLTTNNHHHNHSRVSTRSTTLSSSSSSNTSSNHLPFLNNTTRTMEEVWKDINLPTSNHHAAVAKGYCGFILQDFLAKPFSSTQDTNTHTNVSSPPPPPQPQPQPQPQMLLNLNSGPDQLSFLGHEDPTRHVCPLEGSFDQVLASSNSSSGLLGQSIGGLRMLPATDRTGGDRRHKRMIKNRESAARSRARKQAYTNELENEVERLKEENTMLKRLQQSQVATAAQMTKKRGLQRTSTAPF